MANVSFDAGHSDSGNRSEIAAFTNIVGLIISAIVLIGLLFWGGKTLMRDASGVPVVRAIDGPMRVSPETPGGRPAENQGLSVNELASSQPEAGNSQLEFAPAPVTLNDADVPMPSSLTDNTTPVLASAPAAEVSEIVAGVLEPQVVAQVPGNITRSLRPRVRPSGLTLRPTPVSIPTSETVTPTVEPTLNTATAQPGDVFVAPGTRLVQLGAFESREVALKEWKRLSTKFAPYMGGKQLVLQNAVSGGRNFVRLRVMGFGNLADAERFCQTISAQSAGCYPVVMK